MWVGMILHGSLVQPREHRRELKDVAKCSRYVSMLYSRASGLFNGLSPQILIVTAIE